MEQLWFDKSFPEGYDSKNLLRFHKTFFEEHNLSGFQLHLKIENEMNFANCASICDDIPLFYVSQNVKIGPPTVTCTTAFMGKFEEGDNLRKVSIAQSSLTLIAVLSMVVAAGPYGIQFCFHYCKTLSKIMKGEK